EQLFQSNFEASQALFALLHSGQRQCLECFPLWPVRLVAIGFYSERVLCCDNKSPARVKAPRPAPKESNCHLPALFCVTIPRIGALSAIGRKLRGEAMTGNPIAIFDVAARNARTIEVCVDRAGGGPHKITRGSC